MTPPRAASTVFVLLVANNSHVSTEKAITKYSVSHAGGYFHNALLKAYGQDYPSMVTRAFIEYAHYFLVNRKSDNLTHSRSGSFSGGAQRRRWSRISRMHESYSN